jgi:hypothetical protein
MLHLSDLIWIKGPYLQRELMFPSGVQHARRVVLHLKSPLVRLRHVKIAGANAESRGSFVPFGTSLPWKAFIVGIFWGIWIIVLVFDKNLTRGDARFSENLKYSCVTTCCASTDDVFRGELHPKRGKLSCVRT